MVGPHGNPTKLTLSNKARIPSGKYSTKTTIDQLSADLHAPNGDQHVPGGLRAIENKCDSESGGFGFVQYRILQESMAQKIPARRTLCKEPVGRA